MKDRILFDFGQIYRTAASRLCVSEAMVTEYEKLFGETGQVLYPCRARSAKTKMFEPKQFRCGTQKGLVAIFAGTVAGRGYAKALAALAKQLGRLGGKLIVFGAIDRSRVMSMGLNLPNIDFAGLVSAGVLRERCQVQGDFLYVPMSFNEKDGLNMRLGFPSKLADYTEIGLPLLIRGPQYCSAVQWARKHPGVAEVVDNEGEEELFTAVSRLTHPAVREALAKEAVRVGDLYFSHERAQSVLFAALMRSRPCRV
jgi:hypothetical protein